MRSSRMLEKKKPIHVVTQTFLSFAILVLFASSFAVAGEVAEITVAPSGIYFRPLVESDGWLLTVSGPDEIWWQEEFGDGEHPYLSFFANDNSSLPDGQYTYELTAVFDSDTSGAIPADESGPDGRSPQTKEPTPPTGPTTQSGYFTVANGGIVTPAGIGEYPSGGVSAPAADEPVPPADFVINDDLIVDGSACIGFDCVNGESFGFDTLRLKEHNLRISFYDTSNTASFPDNDWQLTANDSANGGAEKFSIDDITGGKTPFTILANAPTNSLFVDAGGDLGLGTSTPSTDIHTVSGNTPTLRLQQDGSSGFTPQTWDLAGNETNFFIRDATNGSKLPFRIRPGAPTSSIDIAASGDVGIKNSSPTADLHILDNSGTAQLALEDAADKWTFEISNGLRIDGGTIAGPEFQIRPNGKVIMGRGGAVYFKLDALGNLTLTGNLTVQGVKNFVMTDPEDPDRSIYYAALEGPEAGTYYRGTAQTVQGEAVVELPDFFGKVTEAEGLTVQITPRNGWYHLYTVEVSPDRLVVRDAEGGDAIEFDYLVQGVRKGYSNYQVERPAAAAPSLEQPN